jgi:hypothetical protein
LNKQKRETDYKGIFILGVCLMGTGTVFLAAISPAFIGILGAGAGLMAIGLANRDKWAKPKKKT